MVFSGSAESILINKVSLIKKNSQKPYHNLYGNINVIFHASSVKIASALWLEQWVVKG